MRHGGSPLPRAQTVRFNQMNAERIRKVEAGEPTPTLVSEQVAAGTLKVPWTNLGQKEKS